MKILSLKISTLVVLSFFISTTLSFSQEGTVTVNQDKKITELLNLKKEMNKNEEDSDRYKIQIYNGVYEPPNFKTWAGNFRTRLEADRALKRIKRKFPSAFIFKPKKA